MPIAEQFIGWFANLIQIGTFVFTLLVLWRTRRQLKNALLKTQNQTSNRPFILSVGIGQDIEGAVRAYAEVHLPNLDTQVQLRNYRRMGQIPSEKFYQVLRDLLRIKQQLTERGATEVHLFYMGPVTLAMAIGAIFDNWVPVKLYKFKEGQYEFDFTLEKGTVLGLLDEVVSEGEEMVVETLAG